MNSDRAAVNGNIAFAIDLYRQLSKKAGNLFFSPHSISTALAMVYAGARGATEKQMAEALHFTIAQRKLHPAFRTLQKAIASAQGEGLVLREANSIWPHVSYRFRQEYLDLLAEYYGAEITPVNYQLAREEARRTINAWVEDHTEQKIRELLSPADLSALTRLILVEAIYFKGLWQKAFDEKRTAAEPFWVTASENISVPMMNQEGYFKMAGDEAAQVLELPYKGGKLSMFIFLPEERDGLANMESALDADRLARWLRSTGGDVQVSLPRFVLNYGLSLKDVLVALGMPDAFDKRRADFSGMDGSRELVISDAIHQAFVDVNEAGTEAAAATAIVMRSKSIPARPLIFRADHPFLFLIRENGTGSILFMGRVVRP